MAASNTDKLSRAGLTAPARFVGLTDTAIDADGNTVERPESGTCALCGESLRYVVHFVDASGRAFDAGSNCAKWAQLSAAEKKSVAGAKREAAALAKAERASPGHIARGIAERARYQSELRSRWTETLRAARTELDALTTRIAVGETRLVKYADNADFLELISDAICADRAKAANLRSVISCQIGRLAR